MAGDPISGILVDGVPPSKADFRAYEKERVRKRVGTADDIRNDDWTGQYGGIYVADIHTAFDLDTSDTTTADDGLECIIDSEGNRFKSTTITDFEINVLLFGAAMDGTTDDSSALQAAIDFCYSAGGGVVVIPGGSLGLAAGVNIKPTVTVRGTGTGATNIICATDDFFAFTMGDLAGDAPCFRAHISDLCIQGAALGVLIGKQTALCSAKRLSLLSCASGIITRGDYTQSPVIDCNTHFIDEIEVYNHSGAAVEVYHCGEIYIAHVVTSAAQNGAYGIVCDTASSGIHISDCNLPGCAYGIVGQVTQPLSPNPNSFDLRPGFVFAARVLGDSCVSAGWAILKGWQWHLTDCWGSGTSGGPGVLLGSGNTTDVNDINVVGGSFTLNYEEGIKVNGAQADLGLYVGGGALFHGNGYHTSNTYDDIKLGASVRVNIDGINASGGATKYTPASRYAISFTSGSDYIRVSHNNDLSGALTGEISNGSSGTHNYILTRPTAGSVIFAGVNGVPSQDNSNFFYDGSNHRLGLGTASPAKLLHLNAASGSVPIRQQSGSDVCDIDYNGGTLFLTNFGGGDYAVTTATGQVVLNGKTNVILQNNSVESLKTDTTRITASLPIKLKNYTVAGLPSGAAGDSAFATNCRVFNGAGTQESSGAGTGGVVSHNGTAWKIAGTNITAVA